MKAWEEHLADFYLLANDILENQFAQQLEHRGYFYYAFNPTLPYQQTSGDHISQLKLLSQLRDNGAVDFEPQAITDKTPLGMVSKNALKYGSDVLLMRVHPLKLDEWLILTRKYGRQVLAKQKRTTQSARLEGSNLVVGGFVIPLKGKNSKYLLQAILQNQASRKDLWSHDTLMNYLEPSPVLKEPGSLVRDTANNINRRVASATNKVIPKLLQVKTETVQLDPRFV